MKPSKRITELMEELLTKTKLETEYDKLSDTEKGIAFVSIQNQAIVNFLDEVCQE